MDFRDLQPSWALPLTAESLYLQPATTSLLLEPQNHSYINLYGGPLPRAPNHINLYGGPFSGPRTISIYMVVPCPGPFPSAPNYINLFGGAWPRAPNFVNLYSYGFPLTSTKPLQAARFSHLICSCSHLNMQWRRRYRIILRQQQRRRERLGLGA